MPSTAQLLTTYRQELTHAGLHADLVNDLVKDAAHAIVVNEGLSVLSPSPIRLVICAATRHQAQQWVAKHNLLPQQVIIPNDLDALHGLTDFAVVTLPGFSDRLDAKAITQTLQATQQREDFVDEYANPDIIGTTPTP